MKKTDKKHFKKLYDSKKKLVGISMNPTEKSLLDAMMKKEEWENVGGFIKYKLFGLSYEKNIITQSILQTRNYLKKSL